MLTIETARKGQDFYSPSDATRALISTVIIVPFVGATAVGKNFLMAATGYPVAKRTVSREPRDGDDPATYTYVSHDELLELIENGHVVQYGVSPTANAIYTTLPADYTLGAANTMDCFYNAVDPLRDKGYRAVKAISVITPGTQWQQQMNDRYAHNTADYIAARLSEAEQSIAWSYEQFTRHNPYHLLVLNDQDQAAQNVTYIKDYIERDVTHEPSEDLVQQTVEEMHSVIAAMRAQIALQ